MWSVSCLYTNATAPQRRMREQVGDLEAEYNAQLSSYKRVKEQVSPEPRALCLVP